MMAKSVDLEGQSTNHTPLPRHTAHVTLAMHHTTQPAARSAASLARPLAPSGVAALNVHITAACVAPPPDHGDASHEPSRTYPVPTVSDGAHLSLQALVREVTARLPSSTSSQLDLVRELEAAVIGRRTELESSCVVPVVLALRPAVGETHPRDELPPPPLPLAQSVHPPLVLIPPRPPHGTVTHIAGEAYDWRRDDDEMFQGRACAHHGDLSPGTDARPAELRARRRLAP